MMKNIENSLLHNSSFASFLLATFVKEYQIRTAKTDFPGLEKLLLVLPFVWHGPSRNAISKKIFSTPFYVVLEDEPLIFEELSKRISAYAAITCLGLNICCSTGLLSRQKTLAGEVFFFPHSQWPKFSKPDDLPTEMKATTARLANWFKDVTAAELYATLGIH